MRSWLTTHYPHPIVDDHPWHVYLQRQHKNAMKDWHAGDRVFFYEFKEQKPIKDKQKYPQGRMGIVRVARISGQMYHRETAIEYTDGTVAYWSWGIPTDQPDTDGFVTRKDLLKVIEYEPGSNLRGFAGGTGVMELDDDQAEELLRLFKVTPRPDAKR